MSLPVLIDSGSVTRRRRQINDQNVKNWRILSVQSFTARMRLLAATSTFGLGKGRWSSPQQCYLHCLDTVNSTNSWMKSVSYSAIKGAEFNDSA